MRTLFFIVAVLLLVIPIASSAYEWESVELGGLNANDGKHPYEGGKVDFLPNGFTLTAHGGEIWSAELGCTLVYIKDRFSGDFTIEYTITEHTCDPVHKWSKFGVMICQEIDPNTPYMFVVASLPSNDEEAVNTLGVKIVSRPEQGGEASPGGGGWVPLEWPMTHKLVREGNLFTASLSLDGGKTYESIAFGDKLDNVEVNLTDPVFMGFALCGKGLVAGTGVATVVDIKIDGKNALAVEPDNDLITTWAGVKE